MNDAARHVALFAPVPHEHLVSGVAVARDQGRVAFGSRAWEVFRELDKIRKGMPVDVYIYASHADSPGPLEVSWHARYIGHVDSVGGAHPAGMRYRPPTTVTDSSGYWAVFWEVEDLAELPTDGRIHVTGLTGYGKKKPYRAFIPEGPILIELP